MTRCGSASPSPTRTRRRHDKPGPQPVLACPSRRSRLPADHGRRPRAPAAAGTGGPSGSGTGASRDLRYTIGPRPSLPDGLLSSARMDHRGGEAAGGDSGRKRGSRGLQLFAFGEIAFAVLALQIVLSRLIGSTMSYYFAFLLVSLAMLGLGSGALLVQLAPRRFTPERCGAQAAWGSLAMAACCLAGTLALLVIYPRLGVPGTPSAVHRPLVLGAGFGCLLFAFPSH